MTTFTRRDGRKNDGLRAVTISYNELARVDGSARFAFGEDTSALASVSGPIEVRLASELPSKATFEVHVRPLSNVSATEAKQLAATIRSTLEPSLILTKNPRTLVQLVIQSLSSPSKSAWKDTLTAAMINASTVAFLQAASVPMQGVVAAVAVGRSSDGSLIVDPSEDEAGTLQACGGFAFMFSGATNLKNSDTNCVWSSWKSTTGRYSQDELFKARELARIGATIVYDEMRRNIEKLNNATEFRISATEVKEEEDNSTEDVKIEDSKMEI